MYSHPKYFILALPGTTDLLIVEGKAFKNNGWLDEPTCPFMWKSMAQIIICT